MGVREALLTKLLVPEGGEAERLDRYELIAELASGGMATVYLARLCGVAGFQRLVAIKRLHPHLAKDPEFIEMFLAEARLAARIRHPNVVPILEVGQSDQGYYLVMEYVDGDTLAHMLARASQLKTRVPLGVLVRANLDTLAGLHAAHELCDDQGRPLLVVHRDVSPQNVLVGTDGVGRLTDFGVARVSDRLTMTKSGQLKGKIAYMAPEQARAQRVDRRADLFAVGVVLWECLAFKRLFKAPTEVATLNRLIHEPIPSLSDVAPHVPAVLAAVAHRALERDPDARFQTAAEMSEALEAAAREVGALGTPREVAAAVEDLVGDERSQAREELRQWLARSESRGGGSGRPPRVTPDSGVTRVEGRRGTGEHTPVGAFLPVSGPGAPEAFAREPTGAAGRAQAVSSPSLPRPPSLELREPSQVTSLLPSFARSEAAESPFTGSSTAGVHVPSSVYPSTGPAYAHDASRPPSRLGRFFVGMALFAGLGLVSAVGFRSMRSLARPTSVEVVPAEPPLPAEPASAPEGPAPAPTAASSFVPPAHAVPVAPSAAGAVDPNGSVSVHGLPAAGTPPGASSGRPPKRGGSAGKVSAPKASAAGTPAPTSAPAVPDDLSTNPYR